MMTLLLLTSVLLQSPSLDVEPTSLTLRVGETAELVYSDDTEGYVPNSPFVWGPQPHKGTIFFSDFHSGLWAVRLLPRESDTGTMP